MAVEQQCAAEAVQQEAELGLDSGVIWTMRLRQPLFELPGADRAPPQISMLLRPRRDDAEPAARSRAHSAAACTFDNRRVDLVLGAVAVDRSAGGARDHGAAAALQRAPYEPVDE